MTETQLFLRKGTMGSAEILTKLQCSAKLQYATKQS